MEEEVINIGDIVYILENEESIIDVVIEGTVQSISHSDLNDSDLYTILGKDGETYNIYYPVSIDKKYIVSRKAYFKKLKSFEKFTEASLKRFQEIKETINKLLAEQKTICEGDKHIYGEGKKSFEPRGDIPDAYVNIWTRTCLCCGNIQKVYVKPDWAEDTISGLRVNY